MADYDQNAGSNLISAKFQGKDIDLGLGLFLLLIIQALIFCGEFQVNSNLRIGPKLKYCRLGQKVPMITIKYSTRLYSFMRQKEVVNFRLTNEFRGEETLCSMIREIMEKI
jgi:hypothetical protein